MHRVQTSTARRVLAILLGLAVTVGLTACGNGMAGPQPVSLDAPPSPAATTAAGEAEAAEAALAAYAGYLSAAQKASAIPDPMHPELRKYVGDPLLGRVRAGILDLQLEGAIREGQLISNPTVTIVDLESTPKTVQIQDCVDGTGYKMVYKTTRSAVPGKKNVRYVATATATFFSKDGWLINDGVSHPDQPC